MTQLRTHISFCFCEHACVITHIAFFNSRNKFQTLITVVLINMIYVSHLLRTSFNINFVIRYVIFFGDQKK